MIHVYTRRLFCVLFLSVHVLQAQDVQFSQFYANPLYHNPAFAGHTGNSRVSANYRNQWPALGANYQTAAVSLDTYLDPGAGPVGIGLGVQAIHDRQGDRFTTSTLAVQGAGVLVSTDGGIRIVGAGQVSVISGLYNLSNLTFVDQYSSAGLILSTSNDPLAQNGNLSRNSLNFASGILLETNYADRMTFMLGGTFHNMGERAERGSLNGRRFGVQAAVTFPMYPTRNEQRNSQKEWKENLTLTAYYRNQGPDHQLDAGVNYLRGPMLLGLWYRGIPFRNYGQTSQRDALIITGGLQTSDALSLQYSYDMTVSSIRWATGGAHELTLRYDFDAIWSLSGKRGQAKRALDCPRRF